MSSKEVGLIAVPPNPADQEGILLNNALARDYNNKPYDRKLIWVEGYVKLNGCTVNCIDGGDVVWIKSKYGWDKAYCIKCGNMHHTQFMCQLNCCEHHDHCKWCGSELCMCCFDGMCYVCNLDEDDNSGTPIFKSQREAQQALMFGSRYIDTW